MRKLAALVIAIVTCAAFQAQAGGVAVGVKAGTLGFGAEGAVGLTESMNIRVGFNSATLDLSSFIDINDPDDSVGAEDILLDLELQTIAALLDWHPGGGGFKFTAGAMINNNEVVMSVALDERVVIGEGVYKVSEFDGNVGFASIAPYGGIGFGNLFGESGNWTVTMDIGVLFQGSPDVEMSAIASDVDFQDDLNADLDAEEIEIEDAVKGITIYPVVSLGLAYRF